jgi:hypothetical protein
MELIDIFNEAKNYLLLNGYRAILSQHNNIDGQCIIFIHDGINNEINEIYSLIYKSFKLNNMSVSIKSDKRELTLKLKSNSIVYIKGEIHYVFNKKRILMTKKINKKWTCKSEAPFINEDQIINILSKTCYKNILPRLCVKQQWARSDLYKMARKDLTEIEFNKQIEKYMKLYNYIDKYLYIYNHRSNKIYCKKIQAYCSGLDKLTNHKKGYYYKHLGYR